MRPVRLYSTYVGAPGQPRAAAENFLPFLEPFRNGTARNKVPNGKMQFYVVPTNPDFIPIPMLFRQDLAAEAVEMHGVIVLAEHRVVAATSYRLQRVTIGINFVDAYVQRDSLCHTVLSLRQARRNHARRTTRSQ